MAVFETIRNFLNTALANKDYSLLAILLFIFFIVVIKRLVHAFKNRHYSRIEKLIRAYTGRPRDFEYFVAELYEGLGYETEVTSGSRDGGKDIIMRKGRRQYAVEVKLYEQDRKISREKIQKLHSAMIDTGSDVGIFVTTSDFTADAESYAEKYGIICVNGRELSRMIKSSV